MASQLHQPLLLVVAVVLMVMLVLQIMAMVAVPTGCGATGGSAEVPLPSLSIELDLPPKTSIVSFKVLSIFSSNGIGNDSLRSALLCSKLQLVAFWKVPDLSSTHQFHLNNIFWIAINLSTATAFPPNVIHIIGGDDKPVSVTGNEYDIASGGTTSDLSYGGNAIAADRLIAIQKMLLKTKWCVELRSRTYQNATNCNFAHSSADLRSVRQNYEDFGLANEHKDLLAKLRESFPISPYEENIDRTLKDCKKFYSEEGCPFDDDCTYVHDLESMYRERTTILVLSGRSSSIERDGRDTSALPPVAPQPVLEALLAWPQSAAPTSPLAPPTASSRG
ncbi:zinc finger CCCH domain-containing protein 56 [Tanacetum coccineum]